MASEEKLNSDFTDLNWYKTNVGAYMSYGVYVARRVQSVKSNQSGFLNMASEEKLNTDYADKNRYK